MKTPLWWIKWTRYEYWPAWFFTLPNVLIFWPVLAVRARATLYFTAANPGIPLGGFFGEKKFDIIKDIPQQYLPKTILIAVEEKPNCAEILKSKGFNYPIIIKPNVGERGTKVAKINTETELIEAIKNYPADFIIQEFLTEPEEYGVLFYKYPDGTKKGITSVVKKGFLKVTGDGAKTIRQLLDGNTRARFQMDDLENNPLINLEEVLPKGEKRILQPIGNHCRGTQFINANNLITNEMIAAFEEISRHMHGFYFGRFDIKAPGDEALQKGEGIKVMEVNGTTGEPAHIYDMQTMNIYTAYRDVWRNMKLVNTIAIINHKKFRVKYSPKMEFLTTLYTHFFVKNR